MPKSKKKTKQTNNQKRKHWLCSTEHVQQNGGVLSVDLVLDDRAASHYMELIVLCNTNACECGCKSGNPRADRLVVGHGQSC